MNRRINIIAFVLMATSPMLLGAMCGTPNMMTPQPNTLLSTTATISTTLAGGSGDVCTTASGLKDQTFVALTGKEVTATVVGPTAGSRPQIGIIDSGNMVVANSGTTPSAQTTMAKFTPDVGGQFTLRFIECTTPGPSGNYMVTVTQLP